jgi:hypothetical protein
MTLAELLKGQEMRLLLLADQIAPPPDAPCEALDLARNDRLLLMQLLHHVVNEIGSQKNVQQLIADRDLWLTLDRLTSGDVQKVVADRWKVSLGYAGKIISERTAEAKAFIADAGKDEVVKALKNWKREQLVNLTAKPAQVRE